MNKVRIRQTRSSIDRSQRQKDTLKALGLKRMNQTREHVLSPQVSGMINKVKHLISIEEI